LLTLPRCIFSVRLLKPPKVFCSPYSTPLPPFFPFFFSSWGSFFQYEISGLFKFEFARFPRPLDRDRQRLRVLSCAFFIRLCIFFFCFRMPILYVPLFVHSCVFESGPVIVHQLRSTWHQLPLTNVLSPVLFFLW